MLTLKLHHHGVFYGLQLLENLVQPYGKIISSRVIRNTSGSSKGVGFCRFVTLILNVQSLLLLH